MIGNVTGAGSAPAASAQQTVGQLDSDAFLKLLVAQLRYQNPMAPSDGSAMLQQTAQFTQVETLKQIALAQQQLMGFQQSAVASGLVGKHVSATLSDGRTVEGTVEAVRFAADGPVLVLGDDEVPLHATTEVRQAS